MNTLAETNKTHHAEFQPVYSNEQANLLFQTGSVPNASSIPVLNDKMTSLLMHAENNSIVDVTGENYIVKKAPLSLVDQLLGYRFTFQSETSLRQMETNLNRHYRQLESAGKFSPTLNQTV